MFRWKSIPSAVLLLAHRHLPSLIAAPRNSTHAEDVDIKFNMRVRDTAVVARLTGTTFSLPEEAVVNGYICRNEDDSEDEQNGNCGSGQKHVLAADLGSDCTTYQTAGYFRAYSRPDAPLQAFLTRTKTTISMDISVIVPLLNEKESLPELLSRITAVMKENGFSYEVIMVDDGSDDGSWEEILRLASQNPAIHGIRFRRNYGKSAALYCAFERAQGEVVFTMDADLQDFPEEIPQMYEMVKEQGWDIVSGWKQKRQDNALTKNLPSKLYNATARLSFLSPDCPFFLL